MTTGPVGTPAAPPGPPTDDVVTAPAAPAAPAAPGGGTSGGASAAASGDRSPGTAAAVRRWLSARPLRTRLVAVLAVVLLAALAVSGWASQSLLRSYLLDQVDLELKASASQATGIALRAADESDPFGPFALDKGLPGGYVVRFWYAGTDPDAAVTVPTAFAEYGPRFPRYDGDDLDTPRIATVTSLEGHDSWRVYGATYRTRNGALVHALVAAPLSRVESTVNQLRALLLGIGLGVVALGALLGGLAIRRSFRPLVEVEETAAAIAAGDLSRRVPERPASTEVGRLTASLNTMLARIESAFRAREASEARTRRFAADASHELRTPLAAIRGFAELYRQGAVPADEVPRTMRRIEDEATRMGGLVEDLLMLARLDEQRPGRSEPVDLTVLAGDAVHDAKGLDPERPVQLVGLRPGSGSASAVVVGDEDRLRQVVANLVANAVRHTPAGTPVEVAVGVEPGPAGTAAGSSAGTAARAAVLEVRDHGRGLPPEQAERIFERFYRVDSSRQRGRGGGSGLGLSIVHAVVTAHGGDVSVRTTPGGGATFRVTLPAAPG